ncbi:MAG: cupin domain-containing protein [Eubacterium sp.]|nr:cupin domain-containing protein [Eubacterium sp.]
MGDQAKASAGVKPYAESVKFRRLVSGHNEKGEAVFIEDRNCPNVFALADNPEFVVTELWRQADAPNDITSPYEDTTAGGFDINPTRNGNVFRIIEFPPNAKLGVNPDGTAAEPMKHRTASIDYCYILEGEVYAVLDEEEKFMQKGDVLIQRGTVHSWSNRSDKPVVILFVLCGAEPTPGMEYK